MSDSSDYTVLLSGPLAQKSPLLASLERAGADLSDGQEHDGHWRHVYQDDEDPTVGWVRVRHHDVNEVVEHATRADWRHRASWNTPACGVCGGSGHANHETGLGACLHCGGKGVTNKRPPSPEELLRAELDGLRAEIVALKARG